MDLSDAAPRVNFELMARHMNRKVKLVGEVEKLDGNTAHIRAADGGLVKVELTNGPNFDGGRIFEFDGVVKTPENMTEVSRTNFGDNFDLAVYNELCKISALKYPSLFL